MALGQCLPDDNRGCAPGYRLNGNCHFGRTKFYCLSAKQSICACRNTFPYFSAKHEYPCLQDHEEAGTSITSAAREEQQRLEAQLQQTEGRLQLAELQLAATRADLQRAQASLEGAQQVGPCSCCESRWGPGDLEVGLHKCHHIACLFMLCRQDLIASLHTACLLCRVHMRSIMLGGKACSIV